MQNQSCSQSLAAAFHWTPFRKVIDTWTKRFRNANYLSYVINLYELATQPQPQPKPRNSNMSSRNVENSDCQNPLGSPENEGKAMPNKSSDVELNASNEPVYNHGVGQEAIFWTAFEEDQGIQNQLEQKLKQKQHFSDGLNTSPLQCVAPLNMISPEVKLEFSSAFSSEQLRVLEKDFLLSDLDQDGVLNRTEIKYWMEKRVHPITESQLKAVLAHFDQDHDQALSFREFLLLCQHVQFNDFIRPFHDNQPLPGNVLCEISTGKVEIGITSKNSKSQTELIPSQGNELKRQTSSRLLLKGMVKDAVAFFNGKMKSAAEEAELQRKQMENLPKSKLVSSSQGSDSVYLRQKRNPNKISETLENMARETFKPQSQSYAPDSAHNQHSYITHDTNKDLMSTTSSPNKKPDDSISMPDPENEATSGKAEDAPESFGEVSLITPLVSINDVSCSESEEIQQFLLLAHQMDSISKPRTSDMEMNISSKDVERGVDVVKLLDLQEKLQEEY